jgi:hypothetical protein
MALIPVPLMLIISNPAIRLVLVAWFLLQLILDTRLHHENLTRLGFDPGFRNRLGRVSALAGVVVLMFSVGLLLGGGAA